MPPGSVDPQVVDGVLVDGVLSLVYVK